jgi:type IV pilus assembly protein PilB
MEQRMATRGPRTPIGKILVDQSRITAEQLNQALALQKTNPDKVGRILVNLGYVTDRDIQAALAQQLNVPLFEASRFSPDPALAKIIPDNIAQRYNIAPLRRNGNKLQVAMVDPSNVFALDDIRMFTNLDVEPMLATPDDISAIRRAMAGIAGASSAAPTQAAAQAPAAQPQAKGAPTATTEKPADTAESTSEATSGGEDFQEMIAAIRRPENSLLASDDSSRDNDNAEDVANEAPIIRMTNVLLQNAIKEGASDIHVEPDRKNVRVRYRIDGVLYEVMKLPRFAHAPLLSRLKIMSEMNIAERRVPQDGRIHIRHDKRDFDLRVSVLPTVYGEKCVMRILDQSSVLIGLGRLGFMPEMLAELEELVVQPNGLILATGPTGSGKTTTLYSILNKINSIERNVITIEDPVEYQLPGINQVIVNRKAGMTFPVAMRAFLRQDPDIIMVGEVRDLETAEIAVQASLTGHLVLTTLHANSAPATIVRLSDMGVEPFLISAAVIGVIAQRLGRKLCERCKVPVHPPLEALMRLGMKEDELQGATFFKATGCDACHNRGFRGRIGVYELMALTEELSELIVRRAPVSEVTQAAIASGMTTLLRDGLDKCKAGVTTIEEVLRIVTTH